jgi:outer membrane immunogenic protein
MCIEGHSSTLITGQTGIRKPRPFATTKETIMRIFALAILAATAFASAPSFAQTIATSSPIPANTYVNGGYNALQSGRINTGTVQGRVGYNFTPNFAVEGEAGLGGVTDNEAGVKLRTRGTLGAFAVATAPVAERFSLIGRAGYVQTWAEAKALGIKSERDDGSFAVGVGGQYMIDDANGIRADYTRYTKDDGRDGVAVSYVRKF